MSISKPDLLDAVKLVWSSVKKTKLRSWYTVMVLVLGSFDSLPYFSERDKPEKIELFKFALIEEYLGVDHDEEIMKFFEAKRPVKEVGFYRNVFESIVNARKFALKLRYDPPLNYIKLGHFKTTGLCMRTKIRLLSYLDGKNEIIYSLIEKRIREIEARLIINFPLKIIRLMLIDRGYYSPFISLSYPKLKETERNIAKTDKLCQTLWFYSISQRDKKTMDPFLEKIFATVTTSFESINMHLSGIHKLIVCEWYHQDFLVNDIAMKFQLLAMEIYLDNLEINFFAYDMGLKRYELLSKCQELYRLLEKSGLKKAKSIHKSRELVYRIPICLEASYAQSDERFIALVEIYTVKANPNLSPEINSIARLSHNNTLLFNVYISKHYGGIVKYLERFAELVAGYKERVIIVEVFTEELLKLF